MVTGFTSRTINLVWTKPPQSENAPEEIRGYIITVRWGI
jgi:hypothetical protein